MRNLVEPIRNTNYCSIAVNAACLWRADVYLAWLPVESRRLWIGISLATYRIKIKFIKLLLLLLLMYYYYCCCYYCTTTAVASAILLYYYRCCCYYCTTTAAALLLLLLPIILHYY